VGKAQIEKTENECEKRVGAGGRRGGGTRSVCYGNVF